jgi:hypothetical protein
MRDTDLENVIEELSKRNLREKARVAIHAAVKDVLQTPKTGIVRIADLEKVPKTYLGTRVELELRAALGLIKGSKLDYSVCGVHVDCKHTIGKAWMIPKEAMDKICILVATDYDGSNSFSIGIARISAAMLPPGENQDGKKSLRCTHEDISWLVVGEDLPGNIYQRLTPEQLSDLFDPNVGAARRLAKLFSSLPNTPIPRSVIEDVAGQKDYMKRVRRNGGAQDFLPHHDILCGTWEDTEVKLRIRGLPSIASDEFIAVPHTSVQVQSNFNDSHG